MTIHNLRNERAFGKYFLLTPSPVALTEICMLVLCYTRISEEFWYDAILNWHIVAVFFNISESLI